MCALGHKRELTTSAGCSSRLILTCFTTHLKEQGTCCQKTLSGPGLQAVCSRVPKSPASDLDLSVLTVCEALSTQKGKAICCPSCSQLQDTLMRCGSLCRRESSLINGQVSVFWRSLSKKGCPWEGDLGSRARHRTWCTLGWGCRNVTSRLSGHHGICRW